MRLLRLVLTLVALAAVLVACDGGPDPRRPSPRPPILPTSDPTLGITALGCEPSSMILFEGALWISCGIDPLLRVDPKTGRVVGRVDLGTGDGRIPGSGNAIDPGLGGLWLANPVSTDDDPIPPHSFSGGVGLIDPTTGRIVRTAVFTDRTPTDVAAGSKYIWLSTGNSVTRLDPISMEITGDLRYAGEVGSVEAFAGSLWISPVDDGPSALLRIDESSGQTQGMYLVDREPKAIVAAGDSIWVLVNGGSRVARIDPTTNEVTVSKPMPGVGSELAVGAGSVWVTRYDDGLVMRLDEATLEVTAQIGVGMFPSAIAVADGVLWVANYVDQTLRRVPIE